jgi:hypothetical protein
MRAMFIARLICSDSDCAEEAQVEAATLEELERLLCDCGCAFEVIGWPDSADELAEIVAIDRRPLRDRSLHAAA